MADNIAYSPGSGGTVIADEVTHGTYGTGKVAYVKIMDGAVDSPTELANVNGGLPTSPKVEYNSTPPTVTNGNATELQGDAQGNLKTSEQGQLASGLDAVASYEKEWRAVNKTASGQILAQAGALKGFYVHSTSGGTIRFADNTVTGSGYLGAAFAPAVGWHNFGPTQLLVGGYVDYSGTIDVTFFVRSGATA